MRKVFWALMAMAAIGMVGCKDKKDDPQPHPQPYENGVIKWADYLYEYEAGDYGTNAPDYILADSGRWPIFACSAVRNGNYYGRNLDFNINEICEFVVRTKATATRHASVGVVNPLCITITNDKVSTLPDSILNFIPWLTMDGINDAGLVCNINVVNMADLGNLPHEHTNNGAPKIMVMNLVRALLDNCKDIDEAKDFIARHDIMPIPTTWDGHIMIADPNKTVIVEFTGKKGAEVKYTEKALTEKAIMTNFYNYQYEQEKVFPNHACGIERFRILDKNYDISNSMQGMWELMKMVKYTQTYDSAKKDFWCSEYYDTLKIPTFDDYPMSHWEKDMVLKEKVPLKEVTAYQEYAKTGYYNPEDGLWFTTHNSTYDIAKKTLWVTVRERYNECHKFEWKP